MMRPTYFTPVHLIRDRDAATVVITQGDDWETIEQRVSLTREGAAVLAATLLHYAATGELPE